MVSKFPLAPLLLSTLIVICAHFSHAAENAAAQGVESQGLIRVGYEDVPYFPWSMPGEDGVDIVLVREVAAAQNFQVRFFCLPWQECLARAERGELDLILNVSYNQERAAFLRYPQQGEHPDPERRMHMDGYGIYRLKGKSVRWAGERLVDCTGPVAAQQSYSIVAQLRAAGVEVNDTLTTVAGICDLLRENKAGAAALLLTTTDHFLQNNPEYGDIIERAPGDISYKPYYAAFSHEFYASQPELAEQFWNAIRALRSSPRYGDLLTKTYRGLCLAPQGLPQTAQPSMRSTAAKP